MAKKKAVGNGLGRPYKRASDGVWCAKLTLPSGKVQIFYGKTAKQAADKRDEGKGKLRQGQPVNANKMKVSAYLDRWLEGSAKVRLREKTHADYSYIVEHHVNPEIGNINLGKLSAMDIQGLIAVKAGQGLSASRIHAIHAVLSGAFQEAEDNGIIYRNPARRAKLPAIDTTEIVPYTVEEVRKLLEATRPHRLNALFVVAATTGMRQGEILGLQWAYVDLDHHKLRVERSLQRIDGKLQVGPLKTKGSRRVVRLTSHAVEALREHRTMQLFEQAKAGDLWNESDLVFTQETGEPLGGANVTHTFQGLLKKAKMRQIRFHDLRHTVASYLLAEGVPMKSISAILGHSSPVVTSTVYAHLMDGWEAEPAAKLEALGV